MYSLCISIFKLFVLNILLVEMFNHGIVRGFCGLKDIIKRSVKIGLGRCKHRLYVATYIIHITMA